MLNIRAIANSSAAKNYFRARNADYFISGQSHDAYWHGKGAELLGLSGVVQSEPFRRLCENQHPFELGRDGEPAQLTLKQIANRRVGFDITFSLPKSVSVVAAIGADQRIEGEFRAAVADTMAEIEREAATRVRKGKSDFDRITGNLIWADFLHHTARPVNGEVDPQYHIHAVVFNATFDQQESGWKALQVGDIKRDAGYFEAVFRARMATRLQALGYEVRRTKDAFEIQGVPERVLKEFSRRGALVEKLAEDLGITRKDTKATLAARNREAKQEGVPWEILVRKWLARLQPGELQALDAVVDRAVQPVLTADQSREAVDWALSHLLERKAVVPERQVVTEALKLGIGHVTPESVWAQMQRPGLIRRTIDGRVMVSTQGVLHEEKGIVQLAKESRGKFAPLGRLGAVVPETLTPGKAEKPTPDQAKAIRFIWDSHDGVLLVRGLAGVGKSKMLKAALSQVSVPHVVLAPSAEASRGVLRREGFAQAETLAKFLAEPDGPLQQQARGGLIVLDEASLAGSRAVAKLFKSANRLGARILLLGDRRQFKSPSRGDILALLEDRAGLPAVEIADIKRQAGRYRSAVKLLADGKTAEGFAALDKLGWVKEAGNAHAALVEDYLAGLKAGKEQLVVAPTHAEGEAVVAQLRARLKQAGVLKGKEHEFLRLIPLHLTDAQKADPLAYPEEAVVQFHKAGKGFKAGQRLVVTPENVGKIAAAASQFSVYQPATVQLAVGDSVRITANGKTKNGEHRLNNGSVYTVERFTPDGDIVINKDWVIGRNWGNIASGLVVTSHASQGRTVDRVLIAMGEQSLPAIGKEAAYVSVSRGREQAVVYATDKEELRRAWEREDVRLHASDLVRERSKHMRKGLQKYLAFLRRTARVSSPAINREVIHERERSRTASLER